MHDKRRPEGRFLYLMAGKHEGRYVQQMLKAHFPGDFLDLSLNFRINPFNFHKHVHIGIFVSIPARASRTRENQQA